MLSSHEALWGWPLSCHLPLVSTAKGVWRQRGSVQSWCHGNAVDSLKSMVWPRTISPGDTDGNSAPRSNGKGDHMEAKGQILPKGSWEYI